MPDDFRIVHLADVPEAIPILVRWFVEEWEPYYGPDGPGDAERDLTACCNRDELPVGLLALDGEGKVVGTAALKSESVETHRHLSPWLAALVVARDRRGERIGSVLVTAVEDEARRLGFDSLYVAEDSSSGIMPRQGWIPMKEGVPSLRDPMTIYRRDFSPRTP
ncbi:MAG: GNAT family N-acetyltransferase [Alphaproteobacteria bacterium]|nr:GNAT family N-acetyltransferase [Alphaproteobacteria bacterium]